MRRKPTPPPHRPAPQVKAVLFLRETLDWLTLWRDNGAGCIEDNGAIRVYLDRLPIGGFNGFLHLLPEGIPPPDVKPQRPATSDDGDEEPEENF